jgi:GTPase Era involved in 16S rRNA processing
LIDFVVFVHFCAIAMKEADKIIFLVDVVEGMTPLDQEIARLLRSRRVGKKVVLVANKTDNDARTEGLGAFVQLGLGDPLPISAAHGIGISETLEKILEDLPLNEVKCISPFSVDFSPTQTSNRSCWKNKEKQENPLQFVWRLLDNQMWENRVW